MLNKGFKIRKSTIADFDGIKDILLCGKKFLKEIGSPQWQDIEAIQEKAKKDIKDGFSYVVEKDDELVGTVALVEGIEPTYDRIYDGHWLNDDPYVTIHRVASNGKTSGIMNAVLKYAECRYDNIRIDTHEKNVVMRHILEKNGYTYCGQIIVADGTYRVAYQKIITPHLAR